MVDPGPPDEISAQLSISINGLNPATTQLTSIPLQAIVGIARLHVPRSLQVYLHCTCTSLKGVEDGCVLERVTNLKPFSSTY